MNGDPFEVAVRGWAPEERRVPTRRRWVDPGPSPWTLTFDTETTTTLALRLKFGTYQVRFEREVRDQGLFYDPQILRQEELEILQGFAGETGASLMTRAVFVRDVFFKNIWERRGMLVGFNLGFDISRISIDHAPSKPRDPSMRGGFSFVLSRDPFLPRIQIKRINNRANMIRLTTPKGRHAEYRNRQRGGVIANHNGYFVDVATLSSALLSSKSGLGDLATELGTTAKIDTAEHGGPLTTEYVRYAMNDAQVTWECFDRLRHRYEALDLTETPIYRILSEASIGKAYLRQMGIEPK